MINFGQRLKVARGSAGFTQEKLAEKIGVSRTAIARWECNDSEPKLDNLISIAKNLNVSTDWLLGIEPTIDCLNDRALVALKQFIIEIKK